MIQQYFDTSHVSLREAFIKLYIYATRRGQRWDDGIYGPNTREGVRLFENYVDAPYKDGIIRPNHEIQFWDYAGLSKLGKLNWVFDRSFSSNIEEKRRIIRTVANPLLSA